MNTNTSDAAARTNARMIPQFADRCGHMHAALTDLAILAKVSQQLDTVESLRAALAQLQNRAHGAELEDNSWRDAMFSAPDALTTASLPELNAAING